MYLLLNLNLKTSFDIKTDLERAGVNIVSVTVYQKLLKAGRQYSGI